MLRDNSAVNKISNIFINLLMAACLTVMFLPLVFMMTASFMPVREIFAMPFRWIPKTVQWQNYYKAIAGNDQSFMFIRNTFNSLYVALLTSFFAVLVSAAAGYGFSKFNFRGRNIAFFIIMGRMMIPFEAIMIPMYVTAVKLGLQNTYSGMILPFILNTFGIFQMRQYLMTFPDDIVDAGRIDGLGELGIFWKLVFKNSAPAIATVAILCFRGQWDNLLWPLLIAQKETMKTIPAYIVKFTEEKFSDEGAMMAVAVLASIPILILFISLSRYFLGGSAMYSAGKE